MISPQDKFIEVQAGILDKRFAFAPGEEQARLQFEQLALDTRNHLLVATGYGGPFTPSDRLDQYAPITPSLRQRWKDWHAQYLEVLERNPRMALRDMLHKIGESHMQNSWPYGFERRIQQWIDGGDVANIPFIDGYGIVTVDFFDRLRALRQRCGGWMHYDHRIKRIVFLPESDWQKLCAAEDERIARHCPR